MRKENLVAIIITKTYGTGLSTWGFGPAVDTELGKALDSGNTNLVKTLLKNRKVEDVLEPKDLEVIWVKRGTKFRIEESDGMETLITSNDLCEIAN